MTLAVVGDGWEPEGMLCDLGRAPHATFHHHQLHTTTRALQVWVVRDEARTLPPSSGQSYFNMTYMDSAAVASGRAYQRVTVPWGNLIAAQAAASAGGDAGSVPQGPQRV